MIDTSGLPLPKPGSGKVVLTPAQNTKMRKKLWAEREHVCHLCGSPIVYFEDMELDHIVQEPAGCKKNSIESNVGLSHIICNRSKGSKRANSRRT